MAALTLLALMLVTFTVFAKLPGDPFSAFANDPTSRGISLEERQILRQTLGLDEPLARRFGRWLASALQGDLGHSLRTRRPVAEELLHRLGPSLELGVSSLLLALVLALPLGWWLARRPGSLLDRVSFLGLIAIYALPVFWVAMLLQGLLAVRLGWLPLYGRLPATGPTGAWVHLRYLVLPAGCLALHQLAFFARFARNTAAEGLGSIHALFARACGLGEARLTWQHGVRPALVSLVTLAGLLLPSLVSGSVIIETLFAWPGLGRLFVQAVASRDAPVVLGLTVMVGALTIIGSLAADLAGRWLDPRFRLPREAGS